MAILIRRIGLIAILCAGLAACCGCHSVKDAWDSRGVPQQWEPD